MAEFSVVMKHAKRMCAAYESRCEQCPLGQSDGCPFNFFMRYLTTFDFSDIERIVMDWAAANPEPRYPSWNEAWKQLFPDGQKTPCPGCCGRKYAPEWCGHEECGECKNRPIPKEIAAIFHIDPIGG